MSQLLGQVLSLLPGNTIDTGLRTLRKLRLRKGRHVLEYDWDVLVILDACRYDMYQDIIGRGEAVLSRASTSTEWMDTTFDDRHADEFDDLAYISANPFSKRLDESKFGLVDHVWREHWDDDIGTIPAGPVTDHGITAARSEQFDRVVLHYMQPHFPFIGSEQFGRLGRAGFGMEGEESQNVWHMVQDGEVKAEDAIEAYYDNLRYVYEYVETLLENVDGRVVISADHANALGEWNLWGHRAYVPFRAVREVPWDVRDCEDERTYEPDASLADLRGSGADEDVTERLRSLGYVDE
ncbi:hypothetical protein [Halarchaeum sp. P4]|uniref:hypothetical protein n=1 Tax=Halarchaeum sp. P4 TaxID=3421639 RepID=UPI003EBB9F2A